MTRNPPKLNTEVILLLDQPLNDSSPLQRLTVTVCFCEFYARGSIDVYLPPLRRDTPDDERLKRFRGSQLFEQTNALDLKAEGKNLFEKLRRQLFELNQLSGDDYGPQLHFEL